MASLTQWTCTRAHTHTHSFPPSLSRFPSAAVLSLLALFPPESARGASARTALGRGSRREGPAARPKIRPQPRPEWPGPRPSGWAPGPVWGHRPAVLRLCPPHPGPPDSLTTPRPSQTGQSWEGGWGLGSIQARVWRGQGTVGRMAGKVRLCCCCPRGASGCREGDPDALQGSILCGLRSQPPA